MDTSTKYEKQMYLKDKILSQGYNKIEFANFMISLRENGTDVDVWTMDEIKQVVSDFIKSQAPQVEEKDEADPYVEPENNDYAYDKNFPDYNDEEDRAKTMATGNMGLKGFNPEQPNRRERNLSYFSRREILMSGDPHAQIAELNQEDEQDDDEELFNKLVEDEKENKSNNQKYSDYENSQNDNQDDENDNGGDTPVNIINEYFQNDDENEDKKVETHSNSKNSENQDSLNNDKNEQKEDDKKIFKCLKAHRSELNKIAELKVEIVDIEIVNEGFFSSSYLCFKMKVYPFAEQVSRKDKDFWELRRYLIKAFPQILIPPISEYKGSQKSDNYYIHKRRNILTRFMNKILQIEELKSSEVVDDFLKNANQKNVTKNITAAIEKLKVLEDASQYSNMTGCYPIQESKTASQFSERFPIYINSYQVLSGQFHQLSKQISSKYTEISELQKKLSQTARHISTMFRTCHSNNMGNLYRTIEELNKKWSRFNKEYANIVNKHYIDFYKYLTLEHGSLNELNDLKTSFTTKYQAFESNLTKQKEKLFKSGYTAKWELSPEDAKNEEALKTNKEKAFAAMLPRDTIKCEFLKINHLVMTNQWYNEVRRSNRYDLFLTRDNYIAVSDKIKNIAASERDLWTNFDIKYQNELFSELNDVKQRVAKEESDGKSSEKDK